MSKPSIHSECLILDEFVSPPPADERREKAGQQAGGNVGCLLLEEFVSQASEKSSAMAPAQPPRNGDVFGELAAQLARQFGLAPAAATEVVRQVWDRAIEVLRAQR